MSEKVLVGMSGGVDSFVTALLLQRQGYEVTGVYLHLEGEGREEEVAGLCRQLKIQWTTFDGREIFRKAVVDSFVKEYVAGRTPNPCTLCNAVVKWELLCQAAGRLGIEKLATGHYVRIVEKPQGYYVCKGIDSCKDQSYFLWGVPQHILRRALTPLGVYTKAQIKAFAETNGYTEIARKKESMGICFLRGADYRDFIKAYLKNQIPGKAGDILDISGKIIGRHRGLLNYTIGQKRDLPQSEGQILYVAWMDSRTNTIIAGVKDNLYKNVLWVEQLNFVCPEEMMATGIEVKVRGLGLNPEGYADLYRESDGVLRVDLSAPAWAIAPGQPVAFYRGDFLIGGGIVR